MTYDLKAAIAAAAKTGPNMNEAQAGGGDYEIPAAGIAYARFVGYFETGIHEEPDINDRTKMKDKNKVELVFELSGPNHQPKKLPDGTVIPQRITIRENYGLTDRNHFLKIFRMMNYSGKATHMAELLGEPFLVEIFHRKSADGKKTFANMKGPNGYNIKGPTYQDLVTGETKAIAVPAPLTDAKVFLWEHATKEMWDSIYIPGEYPEKKDEKTGEVIQAAKSKNVLQEKIRSAKNWKDHPLRAVIEAGGVTPDLPEPEAPERSSGMGPSDPLAHIG